MFLTYRVYGWTPTGDRELAQFANTYQLAAFLMLCDTGHVRVMSLDKNNAWRNVLDFRPEEWGVPRDACDHASPDDVHALAVAIQDAALDAKGLGRKGAANV